MLLFTNLNKCHSPHSRVCHFCQLFQCLWPSILCWVYGNRIQKKKKFSFMLFLPYQNAIHIYQNSCEMSRGKKKYPGLVGWLEKLTLQYLFSFFFSLSFDFFDGLVLVFSNRNIIFFMIVAIVVDH